MKQFAIFTFFILLGIFQANSQENQKKHFEVDAMLGMYSYSSSFFHAINSVTWIQDPASNTTEFSGYGKSALPAINLSYFFENNIGITAGFLAITADNELYVDDATGTNYDYCVDQYNISLGVTGRFSFKESPFSINMGSGFIVAPFDISESITYNSGGSYLTGNNAGLGFYINTSFQLQIISFLRFKTELNYSYIPAEITLYGDEGNVEQNINNLNIGGIALKTGLSFQF